MLSGVFNPQSYQWSMWNYQTIAAASSAIFYFFIVLFVLIKGRKHPAAKLLMASYGLIIFWIGNFTFLSMVKDAKTALFFGRIFEIGAIFTSIVYLHSVAKLVRMELNKKILYSGYGLAIFFLVADLFTPYFIKGVVPYKYWFSNYFIDPGPLYYLFFLYVSAFFLYIPYSLYVYSKQRSAYRNQAWYLMLGSALAAAGGSCYFLSIFGILIPFPHDYLTILLPVTTAYNIVSHRLMDIDTVIHRTLMWLITLLVLVLPVSVIVLIPRIWLMTLPPVAIVLLSSLVLMFFVWYFNKLKPKIDHLFRRRKYDYYKVLGELGQKVGSELELAKVQVRIFKELKEILYIRNGLLLLQHLGEEEYREVGLLGYNKPAGLIQEGGGLPLSFSSGFSQYVQREQKVIEREQVEIDPQYQEIKEEALGWLKERELEVLIPIVLEGKVNGLVGIGKKENLQAYTQKDIELLERMGRQLGITIENALHHGDIIEKERLAEELRLGQEIQMNLLPKETPQIEGLQIAGLMLPAKEIGGDYYDYIVSSSEIVDSSKNQQTSGLPTPNSKLQTRLSVVIGDVSGKGVAAGLIMATVKAMLEGLSEQQLSPKGTLVKANRILQRYTGGEKFMTMLYLTWDSREKKIRYSSAGHEHIIIYRCKGVGEQQGDSARCKGIEGLDQTKTSTPLNLYTSTPASVEVILSGGFMMGMLPDIETFLEDKELKLNPGDKVILYTDGVTEAHDPQGVLYSLERLVASVRKHGHKPVEELIEAVRQEVYGFISTQDQYDDITLVGMEIE